MPAHVSGRSLGSADRQRASFGHRIPGVETDIDERLLQLIVIALDDGKSWIKVESEVHGLGKYFPENVQCLPGETIDIERLVFGAGLPGKVRAASRPSPRAPQRPRPRQRCGLVPLDLLRLCSATLARSRG